MVADKYFGSFDSIDLVFIFGEGHDWSMSGFIVRFSHSDRLSTRFRAPCFGSEIVCRNFPGIGEHNPIPFSKTSSLFSTGSHSRNGRFPYQYLLHMAAYRLITQMCFNQPAIQQRFQVAYSTLYFMFPGG